MKLLIISDIQGVWYENWKSFLAISQDRFDAVLLLGDIDLMYVQEIKRTFDSKPIWGVHGNHDYTGDLEYCEIHNLHGKAERLGLVVIGGIEGSIRYKKGEAPMYTQQEALALFEQLPACELLICHNSPKGIHDKRDPAHEGFYGALWYMDNHRPAYYLHGHQHQNIKSQYGVTQVIGVFGAALFNTETGETTQVLYIED